VDVLVNTTVVLQESRRSEEIFNFEGRRLCRWQHSRRQKRFESGGKEERYKCGWGQKMRAENLQGKDAVWSAVFAASSGNDKFKREWKISTVYMGVGQTKGGQRST
jgi:hypothetical protein